MVMVVANKQTLNMRRIPRKHKIRSISINKMRMPLMLKLNADAIQPQQLEEFRKQWHEACNHPRGLFVQERSDFTITELKHRRRRLPLKLNSLQIARVVAWMNTWEQLKDTAIPIRFQQDFKYK